MRTPLFALLAASTVACTPALRPLPPLSPYPVPTAESPAPTPPAPAPAAEPSARSRGTDILAARGLLVPVEGVLPQKIPDTFYDARDGARTHYAVDILAKRGTPVLAAEDGTVLKVGTNTLGGNVVWATDPDRRFVFYYAHLDRWAKGLHEGQSLSRGEVIGYVGTTGNAPKNTPHLHFQLMLMMDPRRYTDGPPINPLPYFITQQGSP
jgi:murein DD-endopeptidase MepM/ murein hydrolase activator NlpD